MSLKNTNVTWADGSDLVQCHALITPKGAGTPVLEWGPACSSIVRAGAGDYTLTLKESVALAIGGVIVNKPQGGGATCFGRFNHTANTATVKIYFMDETGAAVDLDLTAGGDVYIPFVVKQNPIEVK